MSDDRFGRVAHEAEIAFFGLDGQPAWGESDCWRRGYNAIAAAVLAEAAWEELVQVAERSLSWLSSYPGGGELPMYEQMRAALAKAKNEGGGK